MPAPETQRQGGGKMKWKMGNRLVLGGFVIATAILVFVGWQSYRNTERFTEASEWRKHTYEVLRNLDECENTVSNLGEYEAQHPEQRYSGSHCEAYRDDRSERQFNQGDHPPVIFARFWIQPNRRRRLRRVTPAQLLPSFSPWC